MVFVLIRLIVEEAMSSKVLAIDIQLDQISSVLLTHSLKGIKIVDATSCEIVQVTEDDNPFQAVQTPLTEILATMGDVYDRCVISIPSNCFFFRTLKLPFKNRKKNSQILTYKLENYLPCQVEDIEYDFCLLEKNSKDSAELSMAGIAIIQNRNLELFKNLFNDCSIHQDVVTTGSGYSTALVYAKIADPSAFSLFLHVEPLLASIYAVRFGEIGFSRTFLLDFGDPVQSVKINLVQTVLSFNELFNNSLDLNEIMVSGP